MGPGLVMLLLGAFFFFLWCLGLFIEFWRKLKADEEALRISYGTGWEVDCRDTSGYYSCQTPPIDYANNDSTDYIY